MIGMSLTYGRPRFTSFGSFLHQSGQRERLSGLHFDGRIDLANGERGNRKVLNDDASRIVDFADARANFQADVAVAQHDRQEVDLRAERLELDRRGAQALRHDDRNFAADIELGRPAADGHDVRLGQDLGDVCFVGANR